MDRGTELVLTALADEGVLSHSQVQGIVSIAGAGGDAFALARGCGVDEQRWLATVTALFGLPPAPAASLAVERAPLLRTALGAWSFDLDMLRRLQAVPYVEGGQLHIAYASGTQAVSTDASSFPPHVAVVSTVGRILLCRDAVFGAAPAPHRAVTPPPTPPGPLDSPRAGTPTLMGWNPLGTQALGTVMPAPIRPTNDAFVTPRTPTRPVAVHAAPTPLTLPGVPEPLRSGAWTLERTLGSGAAADVFLATNKSGQRAAYKKLRMAQGGLGVDEQRERLLRFEREANLIERLAHINVVRLYDRGVDDSGPWLACEYVEGGSVDDLLARTGPMPTTLAMRLIADVLRGLQAAHGLGVVHRDLKPANLLLSTTGVCKVADFGIAKADDDLVRTAQGVTYGSPAYMSPEQAQGFEIDARSDLFSVGAMAWQLLTGKSPFERESVHATLVAVCTGDIGDLVDEAPGVPVVVDLFVRKLLARLPSQRFQTATEALAELQPVVDWIEVHEPGVVARALAAPAETARTLWRAQARCFQQQAEVALRRRPPMRHEAVLAIGLASELVADDVEMQRRLETVEQEHQLRYATTRTHGMSEVVRDLPRTETSLTLLRRAGLTHFEAGNLKDARFFLRRAQRFGGADDEVIQTRLRMLQGNSGFAPFELARHATGEVSTVVAEPLRTMRVVRSSPTASAPPMTSTRVSLRAASLGLVAVFAVAIGAGYVIGGKGSAKAATVAAVDHGRRAEGRTLLANGRRALVDGDKRTASLLLDETWQRAGDSDVGIEAALAAAQLAAGEGEAGVARTNLARVLSSTAATEDQRVEARALLATLHP